MMDPAAPSVEPEAAKPARALLEEILGKMGLDDVEIVYIARSEGEYFEVRGPRLAALIGREGKTLEALNLIYNNIINVNARNNRHYYTIDAEGYRARRADQLKTLALATLERVVREQRPIKLEPMLPSERKIVHLALADSPFVRTESEGVEPERRLVVFPKDAPAAD
jgi:spoIIIJ-associated protein